MIVNRKLPFHFMELNKRQVSNTMVPLGAGSFLAWCPINCLVPYGAIFGATSWCPMRLFGATFGVTSWCPTRLFGAMLVKTLVAKAFKTQRFCGTGVERCGTDEATWCTWRLFGATSWCHLVPWLFSHGAQWTIWCHMVPPLVPRHGATWCDLVSCW